MKERAIYMKKENRRKLKEQYGVSEVVLSESLHFHRNSEKNRRIRVSAVNVYGGFLI